MEFDEYGYNNEGTDEMIWYNEESAAPRNYGPNNYMYNNPGGSRSGGRYAEPPLVPRYPDQGGFFWGRGYGPAGPPKHQQNPNESVSFLLRCGVPHYTLSGLPNILLRLMEPQACGICAQEFNCFGAAQLHYNTRHHVRNVKKWLIRQAQAGPQRPKEIPMRARELYCELCDVQITSKIHADSHYAGRSHRSIVEGNKPPKNPFLLQKNMEERVMKLIRREKKFFKPTEKPKDKPKTESKPIRPELYCEICSTSVTCTEQMTMHLNGRKHLVKEKQHIFKMMKGETTTPNPAGSTDTAKDVDAQNAEAQGTVAKGAESQEKKETDVQENDFDWGQGSGPWDADPQ